MMKRADRIWNHPYYQECLQKISDHEKDRIFCRHTPEHFLDVARLTWIFVLEEGMSVDRELIYAAGLLHDIGRFRQYEDGTPHDEASAAIAGKLLPECGFSEEEAKLVVGMIASHRKKHHEKRLYELFYRADKMSRSCFSCPAQEACDWSAEKKNLAVNY